jgi:cation diffusion facilitator family transporter
MTLAPTRITAYRFERSAALLSLIVSIVLLGLKFAAYWLTGSAAIFSDALESIVNVFASAFALYSIVLAHAPADAQHPYGHGKIEFLSAGMEGGMIFVAALFMAGRAVEHMITRPQIERINLGLLIIGLAMLLNGAAGIFLIRSGRRHGSITLEADGKHLFSDAITSAAVILALVVVKFTGNRYVDPIAALLVAAYLVSIALVLLRRSTAGLMDEQDIRDDRMLREVLDSHVGPTAKEPRICSYHKLRHRHSGRFHWVDFHVMVPPDWNVQRGHNAASSIEFEIEKALGEANATAHVEPCADPTCATCFASRGESNHR